MLFDNPHRFNPIPYEWDWELHNVIVHAKGSGVNLPEPDLRVWFFGTEYGVTSRSNRIMLLGGIVAYDLWIFRQGGKGTPLKGEELKVAGLSADLEFREALLPEEAEEYLQQAKRELTQTPLPVIQTSTSVLSA